MTPPCPYCGEHRPCEHVDHYGSRHAYAYGTFAAHVRGFLSDIARASQANPRAKPRGPFAAALKDLREAYERLTGERAP